MNEWRHCARLPGREGGNQRGFDLSTASGDGERLGALVFWGGIGVRRAWVPPLRDDNRSFAPSSAIFRPGLDIPEALARRRFDGNACQPHPLTRSRSTPSALHSHRRTWLNLHLRNFLVTAPWDRFILCVNSHLSIVLQRYCLSSPRWAGSGWRLHRADAWQGSRSHSGLVGTLGRVLVRLAAIAAIAMGAAALLGEGF